MNRKLRMFCCGAALVLSSVAQGQANEDPSGGAPQPSSDWAAAKAEAEAEKAAYEAQAAAAKAEAAMYEAQVAAAKLKYGSVTGQTTIAGETTVDAGGPKPEAMLLVNLSSRVAAREIYDRVIGAIVARPHQDLVVLQGMESLSMTDAVAFDLKVKEVEAWLHAASNTYTDAENYEKNPANREKGGQASVDASKGRSALTTAGVVVDSLAKLGSYFQSNYSFKAVEADYDAAAVTYSLAGWIGSGANDYEGTVYLPELFVLSDAESIRATLQRLSSHYADVVSKQAAAKANAAMLTQAARPIAASYFGKADAVAGKAITLYDSLMTMVSAPPSAAGEDPFIVRVLKQYRTREALSRQPMLLVVEGEAAAQYYTKKNLWTFVGGPPLHTAGAVTATYVLTNAGTGQVLAAGSVAKHGGYKSVRKVERMFP